MPSTDTREQIELILHDFYRAVQAGEVTHATPHAKRILALRSPAERGGALNPEEIAAQVVQSIADSEPDDDTIEAQEILRGTPHERMFVLNAEVIERHVAMGIENAIYDARCASPPAPVEVNEFGPPELAPDAEGDWVQVAPGVESLRAPAHVEEPDTGIVYIARCPVHGLHGARGECYVCGGPVEQVPMRYAGYAPAPVEGTRDLETMAAAVHQAYLDTCERLGWGVKPENLVPYEELSEDSKELDRASVRAVLAALPVQGEREEGE